MVGGTRGSCPLSSVVNNGLTYNHYPLAVAPGNHFSIILFIIINDTSFYRGVGLVHTSYTPLLLLVQLEVSLITDDDVAGVVNIV